MSFLDLQHLDSVFKGNILALYADHIWFVGSSIQLSMVIFIDIEFVWSTILYLKFGFMRVVNKFRLHNLILVISLISKLVNLLISEVFIEHFAEWVENLELLKIG